MDTTKSKFKHSPSLFTRIFTKRNLNLPDGWASYNCTKADQRHILLSQLTICNNQPIMMRQIILHEDLSLKYFVGKHEVHVGTVYLPSAIKMEADINMVINTFSTIPFCNGACIEEPLEGSNAHEDLVYDSEMQTWRHKDCTYWLEREEINSCTCCASYLDKSLQSEEIAS